MRSLENLSLMFSKSTKQSNTIPYPEIEKGLFGDTILFCWPISAESETTRNNETWKLFPWVAFFLEQVIISGIERGILLRGAISIGKYAYDENTFLGPAITDAHAWSEEADWFGVILTPHCRIYLTYLFENDAERGKILENPLFFPMKYEDMIFVKYNVPLHNQKFKELFALSWPVHLLMEGEANGKSGSMMLAHYLLNNSIPKGTESKYENSFNFLRWFEKESWPKMRKNLIKDKYNFKKDADPVPKEH